MALTENIALMSSQFAYDGRGPLDAKMLVAKFDELINPTTWQNLNGDNLAYNGMVVAVWRESGDTAHKNGIYFLHDGTTSRKPDVTNEVNWHKIAEANDTGIDLEELTSKVQAIGITVDGSAEQEGLVAKVAKVIADIAEIKAAGYVTTNTLTTTLEPYAKTDDVVTIAAFNEFKASNDEDILAVHNEVTELQSALEVIAQTPATAEKLGGIKSSSGDNIVSVDASGIATVTSINVNSLTQTAGDVFILSGGDSYSHS